MFTQVLQVSKLTLQVSLYNPGHTASKWQSSDLIPGVFDLKTCFSFFILRLLKEKDFYVCDH